VTRFSSIRRSTRFGLELPLEDDGRALPEAEQRVDVPAADMELR